MIPAIVFATGLNGLCTVRSLGVAGVPVWAILDSAGQPAARSRYCRVFLRASGESVSSVVSRLVAAHALPQAVVIATTDDGAREIAEAVSELPNGVIFAGPLSTSVELLMDKRTEIELLGRLGTRLPISKSRLGDIDTATAANFPPLPNIFKPRSQRFAEVVRMKNRVVATDLERSTFLAEFADQLDLFVVQEVIPGADDAVWQCNAVFNRQSELVSAFTFQKLGMSPPHFGVTTLGFSVTNKEVIALSQEIGRALCYVGPAGFEFKLDSRDHRYKYIEVNPRFGMSNYFDTRCGVNTALRTYTLALGDEQSRTPPQRDGTYFVDLYSDCYSRIVDDMESMLSVATRHAELIGRRRVAAYWSWRDPVPGLIAFVGRLRHVVSALTARSRRRAAASANVR